MCIYHLLLMHLHSIIAITHFYHSARLPFTHSTSHSMSSTLSISLTRHPAFYQCISFYLTQSHTLSPHLFPLLSITLPISFLISPSLSLPLSFSLTTSLLHSPEISPLFILISLSSCHGLFGHRCMWVTWPETLSRHGMFSLRVSQVFTCSLVNPSRHQL